MDIVCATDDNYIQHCCIMLVSLLCNNHDVNIYILTEGLKDENQKIIKEEVKQYGGNVSFCIVDGSKLEGLPLSRRNDLNHISMATYYRLLVARLLPNEVKKVIYLDCDIVVNGSLDEFWNTGLEGMAIAAILQIGYGFEAERLGYPINYGYFNAGVNLLNLDYFRKNNITEQFFKYLEEHGHELVYNDQDVLNAVLYDKCVHVMPQWNMTPSCYDIGMKRRGDKRNGVVINDYVAEKMNIKQFSMTANIVHYASKIKPWNDNCTHPLCDLYFYYARKTHYFNKIKQQNKRNRLKAVRKQQIIGLAYYLKQLLVKTDKTWK